MFFMSSGQALKLFVFSCVIENYFLYYRSVRLIDKGGKREKYENTMIFTQSRGPQMVYVSISDSV